MITFQEFSRQVKASNLTPHDCGSLHWQIRGGRYCVNFYPTTKNGPTFYVNATNTGVRHKVTVDDAILAAFNPMHKRKVKRTRRRRSDFYKNVRKRLLKDDPRCYWCRRSLGTKTATNDHIIPLSKGGTNGIDNQTLACYDCNQNRRDNLPIRTEWEKPRICP